MSQVREMFSGPETNLHDCLDAFFDPSELKGGNQYYCSQCKKFQNSQKEMIITKLPEVLCVHLKRFRFDAYFSSKISRHIAFPLNDLDMGPYLKDSARAGQNCNYELCAVITHYGGAGGGHYVAFAKNSSHSSWFEFNDTKVRPVSPDTVVNCEGYVLFYKRVPTSNSAALQNIELSSLLLPRPGKSPGDPNPVVYISRHWLHLLRTCSNPGPIFQYEFACEHGAVLPNRVDHARPLAMSVRRDVWDTYQQRYGGGPMVQKLEICSVCKDLLDSYTEQRKREKEEIHKLQSMCHGQLEKREPFLLSQRWLAQWQSFINCTSLAVGPPGPVDNSDLIQEIQPDPKSPPQLRLVHDARAAPAYHKLSWLTWSYIIRTYGGGPIVTSSMTPPPSSTR
jgi:ubiquitin carboxyl-terminal hydrolase 20/33